MLFADFGHCAFVLVHAHTHFPKSDCFKRSACEWIEPPTIEPPNCPLSENYLQQCQWHSTSSSSSSSSSWSSVKAGVTQCARVSHKSAAKVLVPVPVPVCLPACETMWTDGCSNGSNCGGEYLATQLKQRQARESQSQTVFRLRVVVVGRNTGDSTVSSPPHCAVHCHNYFCPASKFRLI